MAEPTDYERGYRDCLTHAASVLRAYPDESNADPKHRPVSQDARIHILALADGLAFGAQMRDVLGRDLGTTTKEAPVADKFDTPHQHLGGLNERSAAELAAVEPTKAEKLCGDCFTYHRPGVECN